MVHVIAIKATCVTTSVEYHYKAVRHLSVTCLTFLITRVWKESERCYKINKYNLYRSQIFSVSETLFLRLKSRNQKTVLVTNNYNHKSGLLRVHDKIDFTYSLFKIQITD